MGLRSWLCGLSQPQRDDNTREVIADAEQTRVELQHLTVRLGEHVGDLRARLRGDTRRLYEEGETP
jgi:hypothetical protein